jgi:AcrR family transcriptional regulator
MPWDSEDVPRHSDPSRKPQLLAEIIEHLLDKSLASVSFRTIAQALGCSTYTLVYHFGTREQLLSEIVAAVSTRATAIDEQMRGGSATLDTYFKSFDASWQWTLLPRNRQLQRLEFEAALIESLQPHTHTFSRALFSTWHRIGKDALVGFGLEPKVAAVEARILVDTFYGIQFDFVLNNEPDAATLAYREAMIRHRERIEALLPVGK